MSPMHPQKEPYVSAKEHCTSAKEPHISTKEPLLLQKSPVNPQASPVYIYMALWQMHREYALRIFATMYTLPPKTLQYHCWKRVYTLPLDVQGYIYIFTHTHAHLYIQIYI